MQLGLKDAAGIFSVTEKTICRWIKEDDLPSYQVNDQYGFNRAELLEWATGHKINISAQLIDEPDEDDALPLRLDEALRLGGIFHHVDGEEKSSILQSIVNIIDLPREVDRALLCQLLLARESLGSTAIGDGIAIPHVRHPIVLHTLQPSITLCFLEHPIDFGADDGKKVDILFVLVSPTVRAHHHLLSKLATAIKDIQFRDFLTRKSSREEILSEAGRVEKRICSRPSDYHE